MKPYKDTFLNANTRVRRFERDVSTNELVWHRDRTDRVVKILEGNGWQLQIDNGLPKKLEEGKEYYIPANNYHRLVKGKTALVVQIKEAEMKITRRQLRRIIREEKARIQEGYLDPAEAGSIRSQYRIFKYGDDGYIYEKLESQLEQYVAEKMRKEGTGLDDQDFEALEVAMTDALQRLKRRFS